MKHIVRNNVVYHTGNQLQYIKKPQKVFLLIINHKRWNIQDQISKIMFILYLCMPHLACIKDIYRNLHRIL